MVEVEVKKVPALRFPEFDGEWITHQLKSLTKINQGLQIAISDRYTEKVEGSLFYITNEFLKKDSQRSYYIIDPPKSVICNENDVLMTRTGNTGEVVTGVSGAFHNNFFRIKFDKELLDKDFFVLFLRSTKTQSTILKLAGTSTIPDLNHSDFYRIEIPLPRIEEQQKIASFLTVVDKRTQLLKEKKAKLEHYKKGIMQQLFSQQIRFKDENGQDFLDWEPTTFGSIYSFKTTNSFSRDNLNYESGSVKNIHYGDIHTKFSPHFDITNEPVPYINSDIDLSRIVEENYVQEGDLVIADASEDYADIGKAIEVVNLNGERVLAGLHTFLARRINDNLVIGFAGHLMKIHKVRLEIMRIAQGTKVLGISTKRLADVPILLPCKEEQEKIASFLSSIDIQIEKIKQQIEQMTTWKKGLLQKMFV